MALMSVRLGTNDIDAARAFYDATLPELGVGPSLAPADMPFLMYDLGGVRVSSLDPPGAPVGTLTALTVHGAGFSEYGAGQLRCRLGSRLRSTAHRVL